MPVGGKEPKMKTTKLVLGILGLIFSIIVMFQSCAASVVNALDDNGDFGGAAGYLVAFLLIAGSIVMIATRNSEVKGGSIAALILFVIAALLAFSNAAVYKDLTIWGGLCVVFALVNLLSLLKTKRKQQEQIDGDKVQE